MKRWITIMMAVLIFLSACGRSATGSDAGSDTELRWQEQYDLGIRLLSEGNYEEAIIAFTAAIDIDPKRAETYIDLANVYVAQGDLEQAKQVLTNALGSVDDAASVQSRLDEIIAEIEKEKSYFRPGVYKATYEDLPFESIDDITIHSVDENSIQFSVEWYRTYGISNATAVVEGNRATFSWQDDYGDISMSGYLDASDDGTIVLTLTESGMSYIEAGTYAYKYFGTEEEERIAYNTMVLLSLQSNECGWLRKTEYEEAGIVRDMYLRFNDDGTLIYWIGTPLGVETTYEKHYGNYKIEESTLYINNCAYDLYAYTAGVTTMTLDALGNYDIDFSGEYSCEVDEGFEYLYAAER